MMDLHEQLSLQQEQENQVTRELQHLLNRFADEYAITKFQMAAALEEQKLIVLGFIQANEIEELEEDGEY